MNAVEARGLDCVIVWGGDGSVACVANELKAKGIPILPLPGGTITCCINAYTVMIAIGRLV